MLESGNQKREFRIQFRPLVVILAAGQGTRMGPLGRSLNKVLFPIGEQAILSKIISLFPENAEIVVMTHHLENQIAEYLQLAHPEKKISLRHVDKIMGPGAGPGYSCLQSRPIVDRPFFLVCGDTVWETPVPLDSKTSWLGVSKVPFNEYSRYCMVEPDAKQNVLELLDKKSSGHGKLAQAFNGLAFIQDPDLFFKGLDGNGEVQGEKQLSAGFQSLIDDSTLSIHSMADWEDVGTLASYQDYLNKHKIAAFLKNTNVTYFSGKKVIKFFANPLEVERRVLRARSQPNLFPPKVEQHRQYLSYDFIEGETFYRVGSPAQFENLLEWLRTYLWKGIHPAPQKRIRDFFQRQLKSRMAEYEISNTQPLREVRIAGKRSIHPGNIIASIPWELVGTGCEAPFHGDLQFSNIVVSTSGQYFLIDWRDELAGDIQQADLIYDFAKLNLGLELCLETSEVTQFHMQQKDDEITLSPPRPIANKDAYQKILRTFVESLSIDFAQVELATGILMLNMAGVHEESFAHWIWYTGALYLDEVLRTRKTLAQKAV